MSGFKVNFSVNNQKATPSMHAAPFAQRPAAGQPGRVFIDTDSPSTGIYRDTGTAWILIGSPGIPEADTLQTVTDRGNTTTQSITIGDTTPPAFPLDVYGDTDIINVHAKNGNDGVVLFSKAGSHKWRAGNYHGGGNDYFSIYNMQENSDGILVNISTNNVAIGGHTTAPTYKLDIAGSLANTGNAYFATAGGNSIGLRTTTTVATYGVTIDGAVRIRNLNGEIASGEALRLTTNGSTTYFYMDFSTGNGGVMLCNSGAFFVKGAVSRDLSLGANNINDRAIIKSSTGNFLIGTSVDGGYKLSVNGTAVVIGTLDIQGTIRVPTAYQTNPLQFYKAYNGTNALIEFYGGTGSKLVYSTNTRILYPEINAGVSLGTSSLRYNDIYGTQLYNSGNVNFSGLPTSSAGLVSGDLWNDGGTIKIV